MYEGRTNFEPGNIFGHENLGVVIEIGSAVERIKVGDHVCMPFNIGCGFCENCERGLTGYCLIANPGSAGAAYGFAGMGPYKGGQAELLRVPYADFNCLVLPPDAEALNANWTASSFCNTVASSAGLFTFQSFCGASRMRAPLAPPRLSEKRNVEADAQAVETSCDTDSPVATI